jgi:hypothetical protein
MSQPGPSATVRQRESEFTAGRPGASASLLNIAYRPLLRWDGYASSIENFMKHPINGFTEMDFLSR